MNKLTKLPLLAHLMLACLFAFVALTVHNWIIEYWETIICVVSWTFGAAAILGLLVVLWPSFQRWKNDWDGYRADRHYRNSPRYPYDCASQKLTLIIERLNALDVRLNGFVREHVSYLDDLDSQEVSARLSNNDALLSVINGDIIDASKRETNALSNLKLVLTERAIATAHRARIDLEIEQIKKPGNFGYDDSFRLDDKLDEINHSEICLREWENTYPGDRWCDFRDNAIDCLNLRDIDPLVPLNHSVPPSDAAANSTAPS